MPNEIKIDKNGAPYQSLDGLKAGDGVYCLTKENGVCDGFSTDGYIRVLFNGKMSLYRPNGKHGDFDKLQSLFHIDHHPYQPQPNPLGLRVGEKALFGNNAIQGCKETFQGYVDDGGNCPWIAGGCGWTDAKRIEESSMNKLEKALNEFCKAWENFKASQDD